MLLDSSDSPVRVMEGSPVGMAGGGERVEQHRRFTDYLVKECGLAPLTAFTYVQSLKRLERTLGKPAEKINSNDLRDFLRSDYHAQTKNGAIVAMRSFHRWGALEGMWELNGIMAVRGPKVVRNPRPSLTTDQAADLLSACRFPNEYRVIYLGLFAGLRVGESATIDSSSWIHDRKQSKLLVLGKGSKMREVPVHPALARKRDQILSNDTTANTLKATCKSMALTLGIQFSSHTLRRTFATHLIEEGVTEGVVEALLGHSHRSVLRSAYAPVTFQEMQRAIAKLSY